MARGREAARAAARRAIEAQEQAAAKDQELAALRSEHKAEATALRDEIKRLRADHMAEASKLAAEEVKRRIDALQEEQRRRGFTEEMLGDLLFQKERLVWNACRYISMTTGLGPGNALEMVITWMADKDFNGAADVPRLIAKLGLPDDGWVATMLTAGRYFDRLRWRKEQRRGVASAEGLDTVLETGKFRGQWFEPHGNYRESWYPRSPFGGFEVAHADDETAVEVEA